MTNQDNKTILRGVDARNAIVTGMNELADTVKITLGPCGRNVIMAHTNVPEVTKDGVSVARSIQLTDKWENAAATLIKNVSVRAERTAGDGTTTATVLAQAFINKGMELVSEEYRPGRIVEYLDEMVRDAKKVVLSQKREVSSEEELYRVAVISANGDKDLAESVAKAVHQVGAHGLVQIKDGIDDIDIVESSTGYTLPRGIAHSSLVNCRTGFKAKVANVMLYGGSIETVGEIDVVLSHLSFLRTAPVLLIVNDIDDNMLLRINAMSKSLQLDITCVRAPQAGKSQAQFMEDLSVITGAKIVVDEDLVLNMKDKRVDAESELSSQLLGSVNDLIVDDTNTVFNYTVCKEVEDYIVELTNDIKEVHSGFSRTRLQERIARITGGIVTIYVGGYTEAEIAERKTRYDDAIRATQAALREGVVIGGGYSLVKAFLVSKSNMASLLLAPFEQILYNADYNQDQIHQVLEVFDQAGKCTDVITGKEIAEEDYLVVDPALVTITALETAFSIAKLAITTDAIVGSSGVPRSSVL